MSLLAMSFFDNPPRDLTQGEILVLVITIALCLTTAFVFEAISDYRSRKI